MDDYFISFNNDLLSAYCMPDSILQVEYTIISLFSVSCIPGIYWRGRQKMTIRQVVVRAMNKIK